ncbi:MAG: ABC transporter permease subunit [Pseudomonadota bacterium]
MDTILEYAPLLAGGTATTVLLFLCAAVFATLMGALGAAGKLAAGRAWRWLVMGYTTLVRGVPELLLILLIYFGGQRGINQIGDAFGFDYIELSKFAAGVFALGFIYGAYLTETFRGAYMTVPTGQRDAAKALGFTTAQTLRLITLPQLVRFALPGYFNVLQVMIKATAVVSIIGLADLVGLAGDVGKSVRQPFSFYMLVFFIYLGFTILLTEVFSRVEKRYARGLDR